MLRRTSWLALPLAALALGAFVAQCANPPDSGESGPSVAFDASATADLLPGTWLREYTQEGVQVRRLLTLDPRGDFREVSRVVDPAGRVTQYVHEGKWMFDGTNLKRRYTSVHVPFATFAIVFETRNAFTGVDHIHGHTIRYERVEDGTAL